MLYLDPAHRGRPPLRAGWSVICCRADFNDRGFFAAALRNVYDYDTWLPLWQSGAGKAPARQRTTAAAQAPPFLPQGFRSSLDV